MLQYQDDDFASLSGARVVRIAVHPDYAKMGYGSRALQALNSFYSGELLNLDEVMAEMEIETFEDIAKVNAVRSVPSLRGVAMTDKISRDRTTPCKRIKSPFETPRKCLPFFNDSPNDNPRSSII